MAAIVKANSSLAAGSLAVLKRSFSTQKDGRLNYVAEYVCLPAFARNHAPKFITGAVPPTPLPAVVSQLQIRNNPTLYDLQTETINGLTYFRATYSAQGAGEASNSVTTSTEQRGFQKSATGSVQAASGEVSQTVSIAFDYMSTSVNVSSANSEIRLQDGSVGRPFNFTSTSSLALSDGFSISLGVKVPFIATTVVGTSSTRNSDGTFTFSKTSTGVYV